MSFRLSAFSGVSLSSTVTNNDALNFGDGSSSSIYLTVTSINTTDDWFVGTYQVSHTYAGTSTSYTASYTSCCRIGNSSNNSNGNYSQSTDVKLTSGNTAAPVSSMPPVINMVVGQSAATYTIPAVDPDNTTLSFALATSTQVGGGSTFTNPTNLSVNSSTGVVTFNTVGLTVGTLHSAAVAVTDASGSTTIVDFLINIVASNTPPAFDYSVTPTNNSTIYVAPGSPVSFGVKAACTDIGSTVTLSVVGLPTSGTSFSTALPTTANPVSSTFSWTPTVSQIGTYVLTFTATRNGGVQTTSAVTINVAKTPEFIAPTPATAVYVIPTGVAHADSIVAQNDDTTIYTHIFTASIPTGSSVSPTVPTTAWQKAYTIFSWTPTAADFGTKTLTFTAKDALGKTKTRSYQLAPNSTPSFSSSPVTTATACVPYSYSVVAVDADRPYGDVLELIANGLPSWLTFTDNGDGTGTLSGTPTHAQAGNYNISILVEDIWHHSHANVTQNFTISVAGDAQLPSITAPAKVTINGPCISVASSSVNLGTPITSDNCGIATVSNNAPANYLPGSTTVTWTATDINGNQNTASQIVEVVPGVVNLSASVAPEYPLTNQERHTIYLNYPNCATSADITATATGGTGTFNYAWTKSHCNDFLNTNSAYSNTTSTATFAPTLADTCSFNGDNVYQYTVTVTDGLGCTASTSTLVNVVNPYTPSGNLLLCHSARTRGRIIKQLLSLAPNQTSTHLQHGDELGNCTVFNGKVIFDEATTPEVVVYPNPSTGVFIVEISEVSEAASIQITDLQGRIVAQQLLSDTGSSVATFNLSGMAAGLYLVQVRSGQFSYFDKIVLR
ncbi:MAG: T9SS type A sorting domain-containing protein [Bacteroidetes bacterium]|nr:T9SS type A sorting domain-containing protein [Bacteroidota bacterium]